ADLSAVRIIDTGAFDDVDRLATTGIEAMWINGPLKLQGEYFLASADRIASPGFDATGGYASAVWTPGGTGWGYRGGLPRTSVGARLPLGVQCGVHEARRPWPVDWIDRTGNVLYCSARESCTARDGFGVMCE